MVIGGVIGAFVLLAVSLGLVTAENWHLMRGRSWRMTSAWVFISTWAALGTVANFLVLTAATAADLDVFAGIRTPNWFESAMLTVVTSLVLLFIGAANVAPQLLAIQRSEGMATPPLAARRWIHVLHVQGVRLTFIALGYGAAGLLFWLTTGNFIDNQTVFQNTPNPFEWFGVFGFVYGVYYIVILFFRPIWDHQSVKAGINARRWLLDNTTSAKMLLDECKPMLQAQRNRTGVLREAINLADTALRATPNMPIWELAAVLEALSPAEALDVKTVVQRRK
jgi:hypothetical protein